MDKNLLTKPATRKDLGELNKELCDKLASKEELKKLEKILCSKLASKEELEKLEKKLCDKLASKEELKKLEKKLCNKLSSKEELTLFKFENYLEHEKLMNKIDQNFHELNNKLLTHFDQTMVILNRLDQKRVFTNSAIKRIDDQVEENTQDIKIIKNHLKIS